MVKISKIWLCAIVAVLLTQIVASLACGRSFALLTLSDVTQCLLLVSATAALAWNIRPNIGRTRIFWALLTTGLAFWTTYQFVWTYIEVVQRRDVPDVFSSDAILFLHIVPMIAALAMRPHLDHDERLTRIGSLDFSLLFLWWIFLYLFAVVPWQAVVFNPDAYDVNFNFLYLAEKIVFLVALLLVRHSCKGGWRQIYSQWFLATLIYALSSFVANWGIQHRVYYSGSLFDIPLTCSIAWITFIGLTARRRGTPGAADCKISTNGVWVTRLSMAAIFSLPLFAAWVELGGNSDVSVRKFRLLLTLVAMLVMGSLVFLKQHLLDTQLIALLNESRRSYDNLHHLQTQLVQSEKLASLGQLVGGAAHELNNPLTAMLGYADLLLATELQPDQKTLAEKIVFQIRRTRVLVSNLLSFAKQVPARKAAINLNTLAQTAVKLSQSQLCTRQIQVRTEFADNLPRILADSNQLLQVCLHITNNALNAMNESGNLLVVSTRLESGSVVLEYTDNGPGIAEPERVFDPFYTTQPIGKGMGLGLSACYGILQEHFGSISCENNAGGGATFRISIPAIKPEPSETEEAAEDASTSAAAAR